MNRKVFSALFLAVFILGLVQPFIQFSIPSVYTTPTLLTFQPATADSWIQKDYPNNNRGTDNDLEVNSQQTSATYRSILEFDISGDIPVGSVISSATLQLYSLGYNGNPVGRTYWVYRITQTGWTQTGVTWNKYDGVNTWSTSGGDYTSTDGSSMIIPAQTTGWHNWTVTAQVQYAIDYTNRVVHFLLKDSSEDTGFLGVAYCSSRHATTAQRPKLLVTLIEPNPIISEFQAPSTVYADNYFYLNASVSDPQGMTTLDYATIQINGSIILKWVNSTNTFSEYSDTNGYCTLDASSSLRTAVNDTAYKLSWYIKLSGSYPSGNIDVVVTNTKVYDEDGNSGSGSYDNLFYFYPIRNIFGGIPDTSGTGLDAYGFTPTQIASLDLTGMDCGNWIFAEDKYYVFAGIYAPTSILDTAKLSFSDGQHWINASYDNVAAEWSLTSGGDYANIKEGVAITSGYYRLVTYPIYLKSTVLDSYNRTIYAWSNNTAGISTGWETMQTNYFNIYNLGGLNYLRTNSLDPPFPAEANRVDGGDIFELYCGKESSIEVVQYWKNLKSVNLLFSLKTAEFATWQTYDDPAYNETTDYTWGMDYWYAGSWTKGIKVVITGPIYESVVQPYKFSVAWNVQWYYKETFIKSDYIRTYPLINSTMGSDPATSSIFVSLWFNRGNASSLIAGRVQTEYYAMADNANPWLRWATGNNWGLDAYNPPESMFYASLTDGSGNIFSSQNLKLMKLYANITQGDNAHGVYSSMVNFDIFETVKNDATMVGVETPTVEPPKTPHMPQSGMLSVLYAGLLFIAQAIAKAAGPAVFGFLNLFVAAIDTLFGIAGWPNGFSTILSTIRSFLGWIATALSYSVTLITQLFLLLASFLPFLLTLIVAAFEGLIGMFTATNSIVTLIGGALSPLSQLFTAFLPLAGIFLAIWILSAGSIEGMVDRIKMVIGIVTGIAGFLLYIANFIIDLVIKIVNTVKP